MAPKRQAKTASDQLSTAEQFQMKARRLAEIKREAMLGENLDDEKIAKLREEAETLAQEIKSLEEQVMIEEVASEIEQKINQYRGYLPFAKRIVDVSKPEIVEIVKMIASVVYEVVAGADEYGDKFSKMSAKSAYRNFTNLKDAGFTDEQAMQIVVAFSAKPMPSINFSPSLNR